MITDPPDGRIPPLTPEAQQRGGGGVAAVGVAAVPARHPGAVEPAGTRTTILKQRRNRPGVSGFKCRSFRLTPRLLREL